MTYRKLMLYGVMENSGLVLHSGVSLKLLLPHVLAEAMFFCIKSNFSSFKSDEMWVSRNLV